jgi:ribosomal protein S27AE
MKFFENVKNNAQSLSEKAKKNVDVKKLEFVIKGVKKENTLLYAQIGKLVYTCQRNGKPIVMSEIEALCAQIDGNRLKMAGLESKINDINEGAKPVQSSDDIPLDVAPISKNERDLRLVRTDEGVRFMKFCPECGGANEPDSSTCASCGYSFLKL